MPRTARTATLGAVVALLGALVVGVPAHADQPVNRVDALDRGVVSIRSGEGNFVSWRQLAGDAEGLRFNVYRDGRKVNATPVGTNFVDADAPRDAAYTVRPVGGGVAGSSVTFAAESMDVPLQIPPGGTTPSGESYTYNANDASVGDLDGDGQYEIVLKWEPSNAKDNSQSGYTGNTYLDAYRLNGTRLWRIDMGRNIRSGAHYTQIQEITGASSTTISRVSRCLNYGAEGYRTVLDRLAAADSEGASERASEGAA